MEKKSIYLDDVRTPVSQNEWIVVRNYNEFVAKVSEIGFENIAKVSLDHDLDRSAMVEWVYGAARHYKINYSKIREKTGLDCARWLIEQWKEGEPVFPVYTHSSNAIGASNIMGYINNYKHLSGLKQDCIRIQIKHTVENQNSESE